MKFLVRSIAFLLIALTLTAVIGAGTLWLLTQNLLQDQPALTEFQKASLEDLQRIKDLAIQASTQNTANTPQSLTLTERDINLGISHFGPTQVKIPADTYLDVNLEQSQAIVRATFPAALLNANAENYLAVSNNRLMVKAIEWLQETGKDRWINASWQFSIDATRPKNAWIVPGKIRIGAITLSQGISQKIASVAYAEFLKQKQSAVALETWNNISDLRLADDVLIIQYQLPTSTQSLASYQSLILSQDEQSDIAVYTQLLQSLPRSGPLVKVIAPLFEHAVQRANQTLNPIAENRAVLLALSKAYGGDKLLQMLSNPSLNAMQNTPKPYTIYSRTDLAQHYVLSAGLALVTDENIASLIGLDKEIADLALGKTISAWDLLADKAGARLAENATRSAKTARQIQIALSQAIRDEDLLPDIGAEFEFSNDQFSTEEVADLEILLELYLEQHSILQK